MGSKGHMGNLITSACDYTSMTDLMYIFYLFFFISGNLELFLWLNLKEIW